MRSSERLERNPLVDGVGARSRRAEAVDHRRADGRCEIAVRAAGRGVLAQLDSGVPRDRDRRAHELGRGGGLHHRRPRHAAGDLDGRAVQVRPQAAQSPLHRALAVGRPGACVDPRPGLAGDDVVAGAAADLADVRANARRRVGHPVHGGDLVGQLLDRRDAGPRAVAGVRGAAADVELVAGQTRAGRGDRPVLHRRLEHERGPSAGRELLDERPPGGAPDLLVGRDQDVHGPPHLAQPPQRLERGHDPGLHVERARAPRIAVLQMERHLRQRAGRPDGVHVRHEHERRAVVGTEARDQVRVTRLHAGAERLELGGDEAADVAHPLAVAGRALELDQTLQELDRVHHRPKAYRARMAAAATTRTPWRTTGRCATGRR